MERKRSPYGEARRLRYFTKICDCMLDFSSINMNLLNIKMLDSVKELNPQLVNHVRNTGIMQSSAVTKNYIRFADWLKFVQVDGSFVFPNSQTVFFSNLTHRNDFSLTTQEKIAFFSHLIGQLTDFRNLIGSLNLEKNSMKKYIRDDLSEHFVESFFEWLVDLDLLKPERPKFGRFNLNVSLGYHIRESCKSKQDSLSLSRLYATKLLDTPITDEIKISKDKVFELFKASLQKLKPYLQSEIDTNLLSVLPIILDLQLGFTIKQHCLVSRKKIIYALKDILPKHNIVFSWDELSNAGYIKIGESINEI